MSWVGEGGAGWRLKCTGWSWMELDGAGWSWVELGGAGWSWVELSARFSNTQILRVAFHDKKFVLETLLKRDKSVSIHIKNLHYLATEIFTVKNYLSLKIMKQIFVFHENTT